MYKEQQRQAALCKDYSLDGQSTGQIHDWKFIHWENEKRPDNLELETDLQFMD